MTKSEEQKREQFKIDCIRQAKRMLDGKDIMNIQSAIELSIMAFAEETDQLKRHTAVALTSLAMAVIVNQKDEEDANDALLHMVEQAMAEKEMGIMKSQGKVQ